MKTYWTMKNGDMIDIDEMSTEELRNTLKTIVKKNRRMYDVMDYSQEMDELFKELQSE